MTPEDLPEALAEHPGFEPSAIELAHPGESVLFKPLGGAVVEPLRDKVGLVHAEIDLAAVKRARRSLDVAGHYARPDIFELRVNRSSSPMVVFD